MEVKLFDSELKVMEVLWEKGELPASQIAKILNEEIGWNRNTTYTVLKKCVAKGVIARTEPNFRCSAIIDREQVQEHETAELITKMFDGSAERFFASFLNTQKLSEEEINKLKQLVNELK